jgi:predicted dehydrogenase
VNAEVSEPIEVAFVGMGNVASAYLRTLDLLIARGIARAGPVCVRNRAAWRELLARRPALRPVETVDEVLDSGAAVIVILTPPESHSALALAAIAHGKHVLVEKPFALSESEGRRVVEAACQAEVHLAIAPFVTLSPTFQQLAELVTAGEIGEIHSARAMYGNLGSDWATWYHDGAVGPVAEVGIYNLQSLTSLLGPVAAVQAAGTLGIAERTISDTIVTGSRPDTVQVLLHHVTGAISSVLASHAVAHYRRPALELYGTRGTASLLGDDWDPRGIEVWRTEAMRWERYEPVDQTWHWTDGLREVVTALQTGARPRLDHDHDLHLLELIDAVDAALQSGEQVKVRSRFSQAAPAQRTQMARAHIHDHTRPPDEQ